MSEKTSEGPTVQEIAPKPLDPNATTLFIGNKNPEDNREFGRLLRIYRNLAKKSAVEVAEAAGVTASFVRSIERGDQAPSEETAEAILAFLGVDPDQDPLTLTDPETGAHYLILGFTASTKGDNSRWSINRLVRADSNEATVARLLDVARRSPSVIATARRQALEEEVEEETYRLRALGRYGISEDEHPAETRARVYRRIGFANDAEVRSLHAFLDELGVSDPLDPSEDYEARGYPGRDG